MTNIHYVNDAAFAVSVAGFMVGVITVLFIIILIISYCVRYRRHKQSIKNLKHAHKHTAGHAYSSKDKQKAGQPQQPMVSELGVVFPADVIGGSGRYYLTDGTNSLVVSHVPLRSQPQRSPIFDRLSRVVEQLNSVSTA